MLAHTLDVDRLDLYVNPDRPLDEKELDEFRPLIKQRKSGRPLQYLTGEVSFMGLSLKIDDRALIPRPETEEMTEEILSQYRDQEGLKVLDLGTGSGAISIALARFLVQPEILAVDSSSEALELARTNAERNELEERIEFRQSDWFSEVSDTFDVIVSNPPYVKSSEISDLKEEVKGHEPTEALDGGEDGLREVDKILAEAPAYLSQDGAIFLEIGHEQGEEVKKMATANDLSSVNLQKDTQGKDRVIYGEKGE